ncbi:hypothetical protein, partial [Mycoplasmoides pirum]|uniref:hypothetical protein n=1 Tax=Mycoplasmoides pirum TaxID=2122 RepID=UPI00138B02D1
PQIPEVDMSTISNYVNIYPSNINQSNIDNFSTFSFSLLSSKAWFSQSEDVPGSISNSIVPSKKYMNLTSKISNNPELYFVGS